MDLNIIISLLELFFYIFLGYFLVYFKLIKESAMKHFSNLIFYVCIPALILNAMTSSQGISFSDVSNVIVMAFILYAFLIFIGFAVPPLIGISKDYRGLYAYMAVFGNVGFIGYPVVNALIGGDAIFYAVIFNFPFNFLVYSLGVYFITKDLKTDGKMDMSNILNPGFVATLAGLAIFIAGMQLPTLVRNITQSLGDMTTPVSLIVIGGSLVGVNVKTIFTKYQIYIYSFIKLMLVPTALAFILKLVDFNLEAASVAVIIAGMPFGANTVILSQRYDGHVLEASEAVFISTILILVSVPYLMFLIQRLLV